MAASNSSQDSSNLYYIHPNENPSLVLVSPVLDDTNYHGWARAMTIALEMKNKFDFVNGTVTKPDEQDALYSAWKRCNTLVLSWINHSVSPEIARSIIWINDAVDVWKDLKDRFSQGDSVRITQIQADLFSLKQGDLSVSSYFTKLKILWDELCNLRPIPACKSRSNCCCSTSKIVQEYRDNDCVLCFLQVLNENFATARSQILLMEPLPPLSKVFSLMVQQERQLNIGILPTPAVLAVNTNAASNQGKSSFNNSKFFNGKMGLTQPQKLAFGVELGP